MSGVHSVRTLEIINHELFQAMPVPDESSIFELTREQKNEFKAFYHTFRNDTDRPAEKVFQFLSKKLTGFTYRADTFNASQAFELNNGNCLSLAILTTSLAGLVDVKISCQEVTSAPVFFKNSQFILSSSHVRSRLSDPDYINGKGHNFSASGSEIVIDYFPMKNDYVGERVKYDEFVAKYYLNLTADALVAGDFNRAYSLLVKANQYSPDNISVINSFAILHRRMNDLKTARALYEHALVLEEGSVSTLTNYLIVLKQQGDKSEIIRVEKTLAAMDDPNPYVLIELGQKAMREGKLTLSENYFNNAISKAPYVHQAYLGLAQISYARGKVGSSERFMKQAIERTFDEQTLALYQQKHSSLQNRL